MLKMSRQYPKKCLCKKTQIFNGFRYLRGHSIHSDVVKPLTQSSKSASYFVDTDTVCVKKHTPEHKNAYTTFQCHLLLVQNATHHRTWLCL